MSEPRAVGVESLLWPNADQARQNREHAANIVTAKVVLVQYLPDNDSAGGHAKYDDYDWTANNATTARELGEIL